MDILEDVLLFLHFLGLASLFGGLFVQIRSEPRVINNAVLHGILTQLITGLALVGVLEAGDHDVNNAKIGVKLVVALVIGVLAVANRRKPAITNAVFMAMLALTTLNIAVAVFWE